MTGVTMWRVRLLTLSAAIAAATPAVGQDCEDNNFPSTFAAIQKVIFENRGCTNPVCHGAAPDLVVNGGLDLRPDVAYDSLVSEPAQTVPGWFRVFPGQRDRSLLFQNVAAKTFPDEFDAPLRAMPLDPLPAPLDQRAGGAAQVDRDRRARATRRSPARPSCSTPACRRRSRSRSSRCRRRQPSEGVQLHMPRWVLEPQSEHEVCYTTYYDITDQVPEQFRGPERHRPLQAARRSARIRSATI